MGLENRRALRRKVVQPALMVRGDGSVIGTCTMLDVSAGGARLKHDAPIDLPNEFILHLSMFHKTTSRRCAVAWRSEAQTGIRFLSD